MIVFDYDNLRDGFAKFLLAGMKITVHSSLNSFGQVQGGAETVIKALMDVITESGLIMMPAFTYGRQPYDPYSSPSSTGIISETFRKMSGVSRSLHPTHSFCAWGQGSEDVLFGHEVVEPFKSGTPLEKFSRCGGYIMLIGVTHTANSLIHVAQELAQLPYLNRPKTVKINKNGSVQDVIARRAGCSLGFDKIYPFLDAGNLVQRYQVAKALVLFMKAEGVLIKATGVLKNNPYILACDNPDCFACNEMKNYPKINRL